MFHVLLFEFVFVGEEGSSFFLEGIRRDSPPGLAGLSSPGELVSFDTLHLVLGV